MRNVRRMTVMVGIGMCLAAVRGFSQGSLTPPGAPAPTMKTLDQLGQMEPRTPIAAIPLNITRSGSYYLASNLVYRASPQELPGILVSADDVTIDLNGFTLAGGDSAQHGIYQADDRRNLTVRNGKVTGWNIGGAYGEFPNSGIAARGSGNLIEGVQAVDNYWFGILIGPNGRAVNCQAIGNGEKGFGVMANGSLAGCVAEGNGNGIFAQQGCVLSECTVRSSTSDGIYIVGKGCTLSKCSSSGNGGAGVSAGAAEACSVLDGAFCDNLGAGLTLGNGGVARGCRVQDNQGYGINAGTECSLRDCTVRGNFSHGISGGDNCVVQGCTAVNNGADPQYGGTGDGFYLGANCRINECAATGNDGDGVAVGDGSVVGGSMASGNAGTGFLAGESCKLAECTAKENTASGIAVGDGSSVKECIARKNTGDGIALSASCKANQNTSDANGYGAGGDGAAIHATGDRNTITENAANYSTRGISADGNANVLTGNNMAGNATGLSVAGGNNRIEGNTVQAGPAGLVVSGTGNRLADNVVKGNTRNYQLNTDNSINVLLCEVPESIDWPCSVKLGGRLACSSTTTNAITVNADDVTIDMNGQALVGPGSSSKDGISQVPGRNRLTVRNGKVSHFGGTDAAGIYCVSGSGNLFENLQVETNSFGLVMGDASVAHDITASGNGHTGIAGGTASVIRHCSAKDNGFVFDHMIYGGIKIGQEGIVEACALYHNCGGIQAMDAVVSRCTIGADAYGGVGMYGGVCENNYFSDNDRYGTDIELFWSFCRVDGNTLVFPDSFVVSRPAIYAHVGANVITRNQLRNGRIESMGLDAVGTQVYNPGSSFTADPWANIHFGSY